MKQLKQSLYMEMEAWDDDRLEKEVELSNVVTEQDLKKQERALKVVLAAYIVSLTVLTLNAIFIHSTFIAIFLMLFLFGSIIYMEVLDRRSGRSMRRFSQLVEELRVRLAYKLGYAEGQLAERKAKSNKTVAKKKVTNKAVSQVKDGGRK